MLFVLRSVSFCNTEKSRNFTSFTGNSW